LVFSFTANAPGCARRQISALGVVNDTAIYRIIKLTVDFIEL
jgi:hypothetical protein